MLNNIPFKGPFKERQNISAMDGTNEQHGDNIEQENIGAMIDNLQLNPNKVIKKDDINASKIISTFGFKSSFILDKVEIPIEHIIKYIVDAYDVKNQFMSYVNKEAFSDSSKKIRQYICKVSYNEKLNDIIIELHSFESSLFMGDLGMVMKLNKELSEFNTSKLHLELESVDKDFRDNITKWISVFLFMLFNYTLGLISTVLKDNISIDPTLKNKLSEYGMLIMDKINRLVQSQIKAIDEKCNKLFSMLEASNRIKEEYHLKELGHDDVIPMNDLQKRALEAVAEDIPNTLEEINMKLSDIELDRKSKTAPEPKPDTLAGVRNIAAGIGHEIGQVISDTGNNIMDKDINYCHKACDKVEEFVKSIPSAKDVVSEASIKYNSLKSKGLSGGNPDESSISAITTSKTKEYSESIYKNIDSVLFSSDSSNIHYID